MVGELGCDQVAGAVFLESQFGMSMDVPSDLLNLGAKLDNAVDELHIASPERTIILAKRDRLRIPRH